MQKLEANNNKNVDSLKGIGANDKFDTIREISVFLLQNKSSN